MNLAIIKTVFTSVMTFVEGSLYEWNEAFGLWAVFPPTLALRTL